MELAKLVGCSGNPPMDGEFDSPPPPPIEGLMGTKKQVRIIWIIAIIFAVAACVCDFSSGGNGSFNSFYSNPIAVMLGMLAVLLAVFARLYSRRH
jgi:hypothetical protein